MSASQPKELRRYKLTRPWRAHACGYVTGRWDKGPYGCVSSRADHAEWNATARSRGVLHGWSYRSLAKALRAVENYIAVTSQVRL